MKAMKLNKKLWTDVVIADMDATTGDADPAYICGCGCGCGCCVGCCCLTLCSILIC